MAPLSVDLRNQLARAIQDARREAEAGAHKAVQSLAVDLAKAHDSMEKPARDLRGRLRAHGKQLGDVRDSKDTQAIDRLAHEIAYEHWHRMLFARFLAENHLLIEPSGQAISMEECEELAREQGVDPWALAASYAQAMLPKIFRADDPVLDVQLPPETRLSLERHLESLPPTVFTADDSLGWTYQFWQTEKKDAVNRAGGKIGADDLPAVTQLFTEHYMVLFLLHNTIGAWHARRVLARDPELARQAEDEEELRRAVRLSPGGGYDFTYLRFVRERTDGDSDGFPTGPWRPAAGSFEGWPENARELRILDPCCGSGHFLVEAFELIVRLRVQEEGLPPDRATAAVLIQNLFGLEIDARCTQIAVFNLALAAWKLAGRWTDLPDPNVTCAGLSVGSAREEWMALLDDQADSSLRFAFGQLHDLFVKAPSLGSLIDPRRFQGGAMLDTKGNDALLAALDAAVLGSARSPERHEVGVAAQGLAKAVELLRQRYTLVITNVPYLGSGKQDAVLKQHLADQFALGKADLATAFVQRAVDFCAKGGTAALVTPQNWLFLTTYTKLRETLLHSAEWNIVARLGPGAFETITGQVVNVVLLAMTARKPGDHSTIAGIDASAPGTSADKGAMLRGELQAELAVVSQTSQLANPDARLDFGANSGMALLSTYATNHQGLSTGDNPRFRREHWEIAQFGRVWVPEQTATDVTQEFTGRTGILRWEAGAGELYHFGRANLEALHNVDRRGQEAWRQAGVAIRQMGSLAATLYTGEHFDTSVAVLVPRSSDHLAAIWAFCSSPDYSSAVRRLDRKLNVTNATLTKVCCDIAHWQTVAINRYPQGLPKPESKNPTQWLFHGRPEESTEPLHVAVARLVGYRWPAELNEEICLSPRARDLARSCRELDALADEDGIVCIPSVRGGRPGADRLLSLLSACGIRPDRDLDEWLRTSFFQEHTSLFQHRPFVWHIWDGLPNGFGALVNYHRLAGPNGEGRRTLEALTYSYLGDWIDRQKSDQRDGKDGADAKVAAAEDLQAQLQKILGGEQPCDIFVRWKPLQEQPSGWEPDVNDGVRVNIRPFVSVELRKGGRVGAGILRWKPNINWRKDRGTDPQSIRSVDAFPWFWNCHGEGSIDERTDFKGGKDYDGSRWNDLHYSNAAKKSARDKPRGWGGK